MTETSLVVTEPWSWLCLATVVVLILWLDIRRIR